MKPDISRLWPVKVESFNRFLDVGPKLMPGVALGGDAFGQAFGGEASVGILRHLENDFVHNLESKDCIALSERQPRLVCQSPVAGSPRLSRA